MMENFRWKEVDLESEGGTISKIESYEAEKLVAVEEES